MSEAAHILVVDDDKRLRDLLERYLGRHGHMVSVAADAEAAQDRLKSLDFDLIVLDVMLPGQDGMALTAELREVSDVPILLLTARAEAADRIAGLEAGADDYLVKPFEPRELLLRITTILRRVRAEPEEEAETLVRFGEFVFDLKAQELRCGGRTVHLTTSELALLRSLAREPGQPVSRAELGRESRVTGSDRAIDVQMARLRRKLEPDPRQPRYLLTMRGEGYVLRAGR